MPARFYLSGAVLAPGAVLAESLRDTVAGNVRRSTDSAAWLQCILVDVSHLRADLHAGGTPARHARLRRILVRGVFGKRFSSRRLPLHALQLDAHVSDHVCRHVHLPQGQRLWPSFLGTQSRQLPCIRARQDGGEPRARVSAGKQHQRPHTFRGQDTHPTHPSYKARPVPSSCMLNRP